MRGTMPMRATASGVLGLLLLFISSAVVEASPEPLLSINTSASSTYADGLGCTGYFHFTPSSGTGSKWTTVEIEFNTGGGFAPGFTAKYLNDVEDGHGRLVDPGTAIGFRARIVRNNGAPLTEWTEHWLQC
jgi:hypothetical protein